MKVIRVKSAAVDAARRIIEVRLATRELLVKVSKDEQNKIDFEELIIKKIEFFLSYEIH
jgi:hypothetical protein